MKYNSRDLYSTLSYIKEEFGEEIFQDIKVISILGDLAPSLKKERQILKKLFDTKILNELIQVSKNTNEDDQENDIKRIELILEDKELIVPSTSDFCIRTIVNVFSGKSLVKINGQNLSKSQFPSEIVSQNLTAKSRNETSLNKNSKVKKKNRKSTKARVRPAKPIAPQKQNQSANQTEKQIKKVKKKTQKSTKAQVRPAKPVTSQIQNQSASQIGKQIKKGSNKNNNPANIKKDPKTKNVNIIFYIISFLLIVLAFGYMTAGFHKPYILSDYYNRSIQTPITVTANEEFYKNRINI